MARGRAVPTHFLPGNEREWTPAHVIFLDTETRTEQRGDDEILRLRLWVACARDRRERRKSRDDVLWGEGQSRESLADWIDTVTMGNKATRLFAHNLAFDLTVTGLIDELSARGWSLGKWSLTDRACWFRLRKGDRGLTLCDSTTWLPVSLEEVGRRVGVPKMMLPPEDASDEVWRARCWSDVEILAAGMTELVDWWDTAGLGNWSVTGNGCGWNAMRHGSPRKTVLVKKGDGGAEFERSAIYGGRRDATRVGDVDGGPFVTVDFEDAYPTLAAHVRMPARRLGAFDSLPIDSMADGSGAIDIMADVELECHTPRYPLRWGGAVWYPVGRFRTTLCGPEIREAYDRGELRDIGAGWRYFMDGHLAGWARWVLDLSHGRVVGAPGVAQLTGKRWGRSVLGRFAQRVSEAEHYGPAESIGGLTRPGFDVSAGCGMQVVDIAGERYLLRKDVDADDCFPAVFAWVESLTRVRLNRLLDVVGHEQWVSCNTDGAIVHMPAGAEAALAGENRRHHEKVLIDWASALCDRVAASTWPLVARPKDSHASLWLAGPQTMLKDGRPVMSGVPRAATDDGEGGLSSLLWPGLAWQMAHGAREGYVRPLATYSVPSVTVHRWAMADGTAVPVWAYRGCDGETWLDDTPEGQGQVRYGRLADAQSRIVAKLLQ